MWQKVRKASKQAKKGGGQNGVGKDKDKKKWVGRERWGKRKQEANYVKQRRGPQDERTIPTTCRCQKMQRLGKSGPYPLRTWRGHRRSERDRMSTGPTDAMHALGLEEIKLEKIKLKPAIWKEKQSVELGKGKVGGRRGAGKHRQPTYSTTHVTSENNAGISGGHTKGGGNPTRLLCKPKYLEWPWRGVQRGPRSKNTTRTGNPAPGCPRYQHLSFSRSLISCTSATLSPQYCSSEMHCLWWFYHISNY